MAWCDHQSPANNDTAQINDIEIRRTKQKLIRMRAVNKLSDGMLYDNLDEDSAAGE